MQDTTMTSGSPPIPAVAMNGQSTAAWVATAFTPERVQELVAGLEEPFGPSEIRWRVTNTCKVGGPKGPRDRGQMLAYADPRAYTDRLNDLFAPSGRARDYTVQMVQNFERKERGATERTITAKIVVTCKVTIYGLGTHAGLGEEWADNENAGTAAEAQAFKRTCSSFGLGRYRRCGRMLHVAYTGVESAALRYHCKGAHVNHGTQWCISFGGLRIDEAVANAVLRAVGGNAVEAALGAAEQMRQQREQQRRSLELEFEQAQYEVRLTSRRYEAVDPENRLVAAELEARWNDALRKAT